jgi:hypothetical protein
LRRFTWTLVGAIFFSLFAPGGAGATGDRTCFRNSDAEKLLASAISSDRVKRDRRRLQLDRQLSRVAQRHVSEMASRDSLFRSRKSVLRRRVTRERVIGQNVGAGVSLDGLRSAMLDSPSYRSNLRDRRFRHVGVAVQQDGNRIWFAAVFEAKTDPGTKLEMCKRRWGNTEPDPDPTPEPTLDPDPTETPDPDPTVSPDPSITPDPDPTVTPDPVSELSVTAPTSYSAKLSWVLPDATTRAKIFREGRLIDDVAVTGTLTYTDYLLWQSTSYDYEVRAFGPAGGLLASDTNRVTTKAQTSDFPRLYSDGSFWNTPIPSSPAIDPDSSLMVNKALVGYKSSAHLSNSDAWGMGLAYASPLSRLYNVGCTRYGCSESVSARIPRYAAASSGSDGKLSVIEPTTNTEFDAWIAEYDPVNDSWRAGSRFLTESDGWGALCGLGEHCNGANAAGTAGMGGAVRPEEIAQGHIDHALALATPYTRSGYIACPATHTDGKYDDVAALPQGARVQLDPSFDVSATNWPRWKKVVGRALQEYGAYVEDTGGSLSLAGESNVNRGYNAWSLAGVSGSTSLGDLPWEKFRVLKLQRC